MIRLKTFSLVAACLLCPIAFAETPNKVVVFGDSYSDTGNLFFAFGFPPPPYAGGRFSDGPVWVEYLAGDLGAAPPAPSLLGGTNFAWGGAESINNISTIGVPGVGLQVSEYLGGEGGSAAGSALHIVWAGTNDILLAGNFDGTSIAANVAEAANRLAAGDAQHILVVNQMNLGRTPALANGEFDDPAFNPLGTSSRQFKKTAKTFNRAIKKMLKTVACANPGAKIMLLDAANLLRDVVQRPWRFGFQDVTTPAILGGDPATSLWWDSIHSTSAFHQILADEALALIEEDDDNFEDNDDSDDDHCEHED